VDDGRRDEERLYVKTFRAELKPSFQVSHLTLFLISGHIGNGLVLVARWRGYHCITLDAHFAEIAFERSFSMHGFDSYRLPSYPFGPLYHLQHPTA
jgi:hypothetical protein